MDGTAVVYGLRGQQQFSVNDGSINDGRVERVKVFFWGFKEDLIYLFQNKFFV